jgi:hypothetical protein
LLCACHKSVPQGADVAPSSDAKTSASAKPQQDTGKGKGAGENVGDGVTLTPDQIEKLGVVTQPAQLFEYTEEIAGYGVVLSHDIIAQAAAELLTAQVAERVSSSALARAKGLAGTPGAVSAEVEEAAAQKAAVDAAALTLTNQRLSSTLGMKPPWKGGGRSATLQDLASGRIKLVRVTFPLGSLSSGTPASLRVARIGIEEAKPGTGWKMSVIWDASADASVPGRSFFALLKDSDAGEGERLQVWAPIGESVSGVVVPIAAVVMSEGKYWCYVEKPPRTFVRIEIDTTQPTADGYFVSQRVGPGDHVAVTAVGQLLAKESASGAEPD